MEKFTASSGCSFIGCTREMHARDLCDGHYWQSRNDKPLTPLRSKRVNSDDEVEHFWMRVDKSGDCWLWTGALDQGYGAVQWRGRVLRTHRVAYEIEHGRIPAGMMVDHICRNRTCVNPQHLRLATAKQNAENRGPQSNSRSGYRGVRRDRRGRYWIAYARHHGVEHRVPGSFASPERASVAAVELRARLFTHAEDVANV